jgi:hypothetical protein
MVRSKLEATPVALVESARIENSDSRSTFDGLVVSNSTSRVGGSLDAAVLDLMDFFAGSLDASFEMRFFAAGLTRNV